MGLVVCRNCGNVGCFEVLNGVYSAKKAVEVMQCCRCGEVLRVVLEA